MSLLDFGWRRRLPVILQTEGAECGMACLAMILNFHGHRIDLDTLRRRYAVSLKGATLHDLTEIAGSVGLATRALRLELTDLAKLRTPCILHWSFNHFVVLARVHGQSITIHDPARGRRRISLEETSREFTGVALEAMPTTTFTRKKERRLKPSRRFCLRPGKWLRKYRPTRFVDRAGRWAACRAWPSAE